MIDTHEPSTQITSGMKFRSVFPSCAYDGAVHNLGAVIIEYSTARGKVNSRGEG